MVELMLSGLRNLPRTAGNGSRAVQIFHVNAKLSRDPQAIGQFEWFKVFLLLKYCLAALWWRLARGADTLYYIPAPGKRTALYRDWIVMATCRPLFRRIIFHWHAVGLGEWLETTATPWEKRVTHALLDKADLNIVLSEFGGADANRFLPRKIDIVPNGIPDPCPDFDSAILPERQKRFERRQFDQSTRFNVLFLGACTEAKGLFATLESIAWLNQHLSRKRSLASVSLVVAGDFPSKKERERFDHRIAADDLTGSTEYVGFATRETKYSLFRQSDCLCFPSVYHAEGQPVTIIEALAFGLPVIATRWRGIPELLFGCEAELVDDQDPIAIGAAIELLISKPTSTAGREVFAKRFSLDRHLSDLSKALLAIP